jgi:hypothetical protein
VAHWHFLPIAEPANDRFRESRVCLRMSPFGRPDPLAALTLTTRTWAHSAGRGSNWSSPATKTLRSVQDPYRNTLDREIARETLTSTVSGLKTAFFHAGRTNGTARSATPTRFIGGESPALQCIRVSKHISTHGQGADIRLCLR